jgi:hypothetical protein
MHTIQLLTLWLVQKSLRQRVGSVYASCLVLAGDIGVFIVDIPGFHSQLSTIANSIKKEPGRKLGVSKPRSGRPKKPTEDDKARIL